MTPHTNHSSQKEGSANSAKPTKRYRASQLAREKPACPYCGLLFPEKNRDPVECSACHANYEGVSKLFRNFPALPLAPLLDPQEIVAKAGHPLILRPLEKLTKKFPQIRTTFCTLKLTPQQDPRLIGFWLLNTSPLNSGEDARARAWQLLIIADQQGRRLSITTGYALDSYLPDTELTSLLNEVRPLYFQGQISPALNALSIGLANILTRSQKHIARALKRTPKKG